MQAILLRVLVAGALSTVAAQGAPRPESAIIVDPDQYGMGNVRVTFTDHHRELWTRQGNALDPAVSPKGVVGWTVSTTDNNRGWHLNSVLRVCWPDGHHKDFAVDMPFIERWAFSHGGKTVVLRFRGTHGPENYAEYDLASGQLLHEASESGMPRDDEGNYVPDWAKMLPN